MRIPITKSYLGILAFFLIFTSFNSKLFGESSLPGPTWTFYPSLFFTSSHETSSHQGIPVSLPHSWSKEMGGSFGFGTYIARFKFPEGDIPQKTIGVRIWDASSAQRIFWNGKEIGRSGSVATSLVSHYSPSYKIHLLPLNFQPGENSLVIQVSNFSQNRGGAWESIQFGIWEEIEKTVLREKATFLFLAGAISMMGFYHLILFLWRKKEKEHLFFSMICFALASRTLLTGERFLFQAFEEDWGWDFLLRFEFLTFYLTPFLVHAFLHFVFPNIMHIRFLLVTLLPSFFFSTLAIFTPISFFTPINPYFNLVIALGTGLILFIFIQAIRDEMDNAFMLLLGFVWLLVCAFIDILNSFQLISTMEATPYGFFGFIGFQSVALSKRFYNAMKVVENFSNRLLILDKAKDEFLASTTHELKTPLMAMIGLADSMIDGVGGRLNQEQRETTYLISSSAKRLSSLVDDLMDFTQMKSNSLSLNKVTLDLRQITDLALNTLKFLYESKGLTVFNRIPFDFPYLFADASRLQQILLNLIGNAIKFCPKGSILISAKIESGKAIISISDTGVGIAASDLNSIFLSFKQIEDSFGQRHSGLGLGLAIVKNLVELHGGRIWVKSTLGEGSEFCFTMELGKSSSERLITEQTENLTSVPEEESDLDDLSLEIAEIRKSNVKVLIVDDEALNRQILKAYLTELDCQVYEASSGLSALEVIRSMDSLDILLLDILMPGMSGYEVCKILRQEYSLYELPILFLTSKSMVLDLVAALEVGGNDFIAKPFNKQELITRTTNLILLKSAVKEQNKYIAIQSELRIARDLQNSILPLSPPSLDRLRINFSYNPIDSVGGDYFDFHPISKTELGILVGDVSGHGIPAALVSAMLKIAYSTEADHAKNPGEILNKINSTLIGKMQGAFLTASAIYINCEESYLLHARAGHPPLFLLRKSELQPIQSLPEGMVIGFLDTLNLKPDRVELESGDRIFLYTDGYYEARNKEGDVFGLTRWSDLLLETKNLSIEDAQIYIKDKVKNFMGKGKFEDDLTLLVIDFD